MGRMAAGGDHCQAQNGEWYAILLGLGDLVFPAMLMTWIRTNQGAKSHGKFPAEDSNEDSRHRQSRQGSHTTNNDERCQPIPVSDRLESEAGGIQTPFWKLELTIDE